MFKVSYKEEKSEGCKNFHYLNSPRSSKDVTRYLPDSVPCYEHSVVSGDQSKQL